MIRAVLLLGVCATCWGQEGLVELTDSRIRAAEIFAGADPEMDLGAAPAPGVRRRVTRGQLIRWARQAGVSEDDLPGEVTLVRKLRRWPASEAAETLLGLLAEAAAVEPERVSLELKGFTEPDIPDGPLEWSLLGAPGALDRPARLSLRWRDPGGRTGVESLTAAIRVRAPALAAATDLPVGAVAAPVDFLSTEVDLRNLREPYLSNLEQDKTFVLKFSMKAGEALRADFLEHRADVERGAVVELLVAVGRIRLRAPARAEGEGSAGDRIPFRNLATNQRVVARIADSHTAEVTIP